MKNFIYIEPRIPNRFNEYKIPSEIPLDSLPWGSTPLDKRAYTALVRYIQREKSDPSYVSTVRDVFELCYRASSDDPIITMRSIGGILGYGKQSYERTCQVFSVAGFHLPRISFWDY